MSCEAERYMHDVLRETWLRTFRPSTVDYAFILGEEAKSQYADELSFYDVPDDRDHLTWKVRMAMRYALAGEYDYMFRCDNDTYVAVDRLLASDYQTRDMTNGYGGTGIWFNRDVMHFLLAHDKPLWSSNSKQWHPTWETWGFFDDKWIVNAYGQGGRGAPFIDARYSSTAGFSPMPNNNVITYHQDVDRSLRHDSGARMRQAHLHYLHGAWRLEDIPAYEDRTSSPQIP